VRRADDAGIVILCATSDEGNNVRECYPADWAGTRYMNTISIAASDKYGKLLNWSKDGGYEYLFKGKDILAGAVPFVASQDHICGSSPATAIAAGLASLTLSCYHLANNAHGKSEHLVRSKFKSMAQQGNVGNKYVMLQRLSGKIPFGPLSKMEEVLRKEFGITAEQ
jgi:hypothetical protein